MSGTRTLHHQESAEFRAAAELVGRRVRALREARGWSVDETAKQLDMKRNYVFVLERGTANPSLAILVSIARAFGIGLPELLAPDDR